MEWLRGLLRRFLDATRPDVEAGRCPRCTSTETSPLGAAHSSMQWFRCNKCRHVWATGRKSSE